MKILGAVSTLDKDDQGEYLDTSYMGGIIIMLNEKEARSLTLLQRAWDNETFRFDSGGHPQSKNMSDAFKAVYSFIDAKFAVNEFREMVE